MLDPAPTARVPDANTANLRTIVSRAADGSELSDTKAAEISLFLAGTTEYRRVLSFLAMYDLTALKAQVRVWLLRHALQIVAE